MSYMRGGAILNIDLTTGKVSREPTSSYQELFIGGRGINDKIVYDRVGPEIGPLDPGNVIAFGTGPFTGTAVPELTRLTEEKSGAWRESVPHRTNIKPAIAVNTINSVLMIPSSPLI